MAVELMKILLRVHSDLRWLILLLALVILVKFTVGWLRRSNFQKMDRGLSAAFSGLVDTQVMIGLIFLIWNGLAGGGFPRHRLEHAFTMILVAVLAHLPARWKNAADPVRFRNTVFCVLGALALIYVGVAVLPNGWSR